MATVLERVREFHNSEERESITIPLRLIDTSIYALLEERYKRFLETQIDYFPYMLKSQWRTFYGKSRGAGHNAIKKLVDNKVLGEAKYRGCHYIYPLTRAMKWRTNDKNSKPMDSKEKRSSDLTLLDNFMRAEFFLHKGNPIMIDVLPVFDIFLKRNDNLPEVLPGAFKNLYHDWNSKSIFKDKSLNLEFAHTGENKGELINIKGNLDSYRFIALCLQSLTNRRCYFRRISLGNNRFHVNLAIPHLGDFKNERFNEIINDMNQICSCFEKSSFSFTILCENEEQKENVGQSLKRLLILRQKNTTADYLNANQSSVYNTNIERYFVEGDADNLFDHDLSGLEKLLTQYKDFLIEA